MHIGWACGKLVLRIVDPVQGMHEAIAGSIAAYASPLTARLHHSTTQAVYGSVGGATTHLHQRADQTAVWASL